MFQIIITKISTKDTNRLPIKINQKRNFNTLQEYLYIYMCLKTWMKYTKNVRINVKLMKDIRSSLKL